MRFPFYFQLDKFDCGPTCLKMVAKYFGKSYDLQYLRDKCFVTRNGVSLLGISQAAETLGLRSLMVKVELEVLIKECPLPAILHWNQEHFIVLYKIRRKKSLFYGKTSNQFIIGDPAFGITKIDEETFRKCWTASSSIPGVALLLEPTSNFHTNKVMREHSPRYVFLLSYLRPFKRQLWTLSFYMILSAAIASSFPYLTKGVVDKGVASKSYYFVTLFFVSQLFLFLGSTVVEMLRRWLALHINAKVSLHIVSDFLKKMLRLPTVFFDSKSIGDITQRVNDHHRIEGFLSNDVVSTFFSLAIIMVFASMLLLYSWIIGVIFIGLSLLGVFWIFLFQRKRRKLDYIRFAHSKLSQEKLFEMISGIQEIKLYGSETAKRWEWEFLHLRLYRLNISSLKLEQFQTTGFMFLTHLKNIVISFLSAVLVIKGEMSLGVMLSISYIMGQTNGPLDQMVRFFKSAQDASLSLDRLLEIHQSREEEKEADSLSSEVDRKCLIGNDLILKNVSFQYQGPRSPFVLKNICLNIPTGRITAIVGASGSGKSTLMKLLLGSYKPIEGNICVGDVNLSTCTPGNWRRLCGTVMQDGFIFNDTITRNIALDGEEVDLARLKMAAEISNIEEFVSQLPLRYHTRIGNSGVGLSGGQKQRILIARSVYKDPQYLFLDEATSSLDANNERLVMSNLNSFFKGRTVIIIAHRLSTVMNADQIVVLENGGIAEIGTHQLLINKRGRYYELIKNQLELGD